MSRIRKFFLVKFAEFRQPLTNMQIKQQPLLKYKSLYQFLLRHAPAPGTAQPVFARLAPEGGLALPAAYALPTPSVTAPALTSSSSPAPSMGGAASASATPGGPASGTIAVGPESYYIGYGSHAHATVSLYSQRISFVILSGVCGYQPVEKSWLIFITP